MGEDQVQIPSGWTRESLGEILNYEQPYKYAVDSTEYNNNSGTPVLTAGKSFILGFTSEENNVYSDTPVIIFDDFTTDSKFVDFPFKVKSSAMKFLKAKNDDLNLKLIYEFIQKLKIRETGGDHKRRWISEFSKIKINLPSSKEQTQIANILSKVDQAIYQTEKLISKYSRIKTGLMQDLLTKGMDKTGNLRSEETHEFKNSPLGRIPKEWIVENLNTFISFISYGFTNPMPESAEGPYMVTAANINQGRIMYESSRRTTIKAYEELLTKKSRPKLNDVLITKDGSIGRLAIVDSESLCINQSVAVMRIKKELVYPLFFKILLESDKYQDLIIADSGGSTIKHIYITRIDKMPLAIPNELGEQKNILEIIESKDLIIKQLKTQLSKLQSLKTGLMQDLLSGKVRVNDLIKETSV